MFCYFFTELPTTLRFFCVGYKCVELKGKRQCLKWMGPNGFYEVCVVWGMTRAVGKIVYDYELKRIILQNRPECKTCIIYICQLCTEDWSSTLESFLYCKCFSFKYWNNWNHDNRHYLESNVLKRCRAAFGNIKWTHFGGCGFKAYSVTLCIFFCRWRA